MYGIAAAIALLIGQAVSIPTLSVKGSKFFTSDGNQFFIKGVAYQLTDDDPLADGDQCQRDIALMKTIGTNAIRVYHVDPDANHDTCMQAFSDAGIHAFIDLDTFATYIIATSPQWNETLYAAYQKVMDAFHNYDNTGGFFVGNEVLTTGTDSPAAPYVKAAARDMKVYRDSKGYREIPIGYSAADIADLRPNLQNYMACGTDSTDRLDFFSLNAYEWCGDSSFEQSGYSQLAANASDYPIPIFFSETGCNTAPPRTFGDQAAILGSDMDDKWSGAIIYEWIEETNDYGLISYGPPAAATATDAGVVAGYTRSGTPTPISPDFDNLSSQWATLNPTGVSANAYSPTETSISCPAYTSGLWMVSGAVPLPTIGAKAVSSSSHATMSGASTTGSGGAGSASGTASPTTTGSGSATVSDGSSLATSSSAAVRRDLSALDWQILYAGMTVVGFVLFILTIMGVM